MRTTIPMWIAALASLGLGVAGGCNAMQRTTTLTERPAEIPQAIPQGIPEALPASPPLRPVVATVKEAPNALAYRPVRIAGSRDSAEQIISRVGGDVAFGIGPDGIL